MQEREIKTRHIMNDLYRVGVGVGYHFCPSQVWASFASSQIMVWSRAPEALQIYHETPFIWLFYLMMTVGPTILERLEFWSTNFGTVSLLSYTNDVLKTMGRYFYMESCCYNDCMCIHQTIGPTVIDFELNLIDLILNDYSQLNFSAYCSMELGRTFPSFTRYLYY